ncbi:MAG: methyltransferase domain-containing protein [Chloroflexi bacterium]|nr:methyltransferase domain-containing protein [Chloroflexota bacterium]
MSHAGRDFGLGRRKVFPAAQAGSLLNPLRRLVQPPERTVAAMGLHPGARVVELGCGPGFFSPFVVSAVPQGRVVLVDLQAEMLRVARGRLATPRVTFVQADAVLLPFATGSFDAALLATMLGEVSDPGACLDEVRRVMRPGGAVTISETRRDSDFIPFGALRQLLARYSFDFIDRSGIAWEYIARFRSA